MQPTIKIILFNYKEVFQGKIGYRKFFRLISAYAPISKKIVEALYNLVHIILFNNKPNEVIKYDTCFNGFF